MMLRLKRPLPVLLVLAGCLLFVPSSWAQAPYGHPGGFHRGYEISTGFTFFSFEDKMALDNDFGWGFRFGYLYNPQHEIEFLINWVSTTGTVENATPPPSFFGTADDITNFQFAYVFNFTSHDIVPYLTAGVGFVDTHDSALGSESDFPTVGLGAGVRFFMGRTFYARFEARDNFFKGGLPVYSNDENFSFWETTFGVGWRLPL
jgi:outer membrane protein with beta-barrel domain